MSKIQLDDIYHQHEQQIENDLIQMMNGYFASLKRSPSNQAEMTLFFKSLRMRMSNICKSVGAKCNADMVQQEGQADHKIPLDAAGHTSWAKSKDESVAETSSTTTDVQTAPKNTSLSKDIDQFLQRTRIATKRSSSESIDDVRKQRSRHSYESDIQNIEHRAFQKKQLSFEMAKQLRFQLYAILQAEIRPSSNAICTSCFFCERTMEASFDAWKTHLLNHTGEKEFFCGGCNTALSSKVLPEHCIWQWTDFE
ncbi:uncharacterized protein LOC116348234 isoform X2 [Contarinia nasturtii]|uniref:uncharacterized protein LOC116348234 isoform X2 n=1 Tax=Contarinia nasturtii TaxID=265458 RepID=UPI0012D48888|nr:uncharacterized protein LOC116348234 isoform X2 [Contarinia nasturtii]